MKIVKVKSNSLAEKIGLRPGDHLLKINGKKVLDEIDYKFRFTEELNRMVLVEPIGVF